MRHPFMILLANVVLLLLLATTTASGQSLQALMKVGDFEGESIIQGYQGWSDILSYNISVQNHGWTPDEPEAPASLSPMYVQKHVDLSSPALFQAALTQERIHVDGDPDPPDAQIHVVGDFGAGIAPHITWLFEDVVIGSYNTEFDSGAALELVALDYGKITYEYYLYNAMGNLDGYAWAEYDRRPEPATLVFGGDLAGFEFVTQFQSQPTPEPATVVLAGITAVTVLVVRRVRGLRKGG